MKLTHFFITRQTSDLCLIAASPLGWNRYYLKLMEMAFASEADCAMHQSLLVRKKNIEQVKCD